MREGRVYPSQTSTGRSRVSSCSRSSKASSVLSERVNMDAKKAAMVAEVSLLQENDRSHKTIKTFVYEEFNAIQEVRDYPGAKIYDTSSC